MKWKSNLEIFALCIIYFTLKTIRASEYVESETTKKDKYYGLFSVAGDNKFHRHFRIFFFLNKMKAIILLIFFWHHQNTALCGSPLPWVPFVFKGACVQRIKIDKKYYHYWSKTDGRGKKGVLHNALGNVI